MSKSVSISIVLGVCLLVGARAKQWAPDSFPNPSTPEGAKECGRGDVLGFICDPEGLLTPESADVVEGHIKQIREAVAPYGSSLCREKDPSYSPGFQVGVAIVSSPIVKGPNESRGEAAKRFAYTVFDTWGIGDEGCGNGVLLLLAVEDREVYIAEGSDIGSFASKEELQSVITGMRAELRARNYDRAVEQAVIDLGLLLGGSGPHKKDSSSNWPTIAVWAVATPFVAGFFIWAHMSGKKQSEAQNILQKLQEEQETARLTGKYPATSCPICFEDLQPVKPEPPSAPPLQEEKEDLPSEEKTSELDQPLLTQRRSREKVVHSPLAEQSVSAKEGDDADSKGLRKPLFLPCGHTFCVPCITEWLERNTKCPICRADVRPEDTSVSRQRALANRSDWAMDYDDTRYRNEVAFRMGRLHRLYPRQVTSQMVDTAGQSGWVDFSAMREQMMQSDTRATFQNSGHAGSTASFGGGQSSGGVGGSW